ncbi:MAG: tetratricopeptide repeat protein [Lentisphaerae bacterium]|nr:tetratricopeptide repeat protein [Lentisphaerota bacterium]
MTRWALLAGLLLAHTVCAADPLPESDRLQLADGLYARDMHDLAAAEYAAFLRDHAASPEAAAATYRLAECYRALGRRPDADKAFKAVVDGFPQSDYRFRAAFRRADLHLEMGQPESARALYNELLAAGPPPDIAAAALFFMADAARQTGDAAAAETALERIRKEHPTSEYCAYALLKLGEIHTGQSMNSPGDDVLAMYTQALTNAPTERVAAEALFQLAEARYARGEYDQSATLYQRLLTSYPGDIRAGRARLRGAWAAHNAGLYADALRLADQALSDPAPAEKADWLYLKANCQRQLVRDADALATYTALLAAAPEGKLADAARLELALTLYRMGRYDDAVAAAQKLTLTPDNRKDVYWLLAESFAALKRDDEAVQYYRLIATEFPQSDVAADAMYRLAYHLQTRGDAHEAAQFYERVAAGFPQHALAPQALLAAGFCRTATGQDDDAVRIWSRLVEKFPQDARVEEALYRKALGEIRLERRDQALATMRTLLAKFPASSFAADAHFWQGALLREANRPADAERELRLALDAKPRLELERECRLNLALILHQRGAFEEAADNLQSLLAGPERKDLTPSLLQWLAEYEGEKKRPERAAAAAEALIAVSENDAGRQIGWTLLGRTHLARHRPADAQAAFAKALSFPTRTAFAAEAALRLGDLKLDAGEPAAAAPYYEQAAGLASDDSLTGLRAQAYAGLGRAAKAGGDAESAARYFLSVAVLYDDAALVPECLGEAALALQQQGRADDARRTADELRQRYPKSEWIARMDTAGLAADAAPKGKAAP